MDDKPIVTKHASKRIRKRLNVSKSSVDTNAEQAYLNGVTHAETSGSLNRYINMLYLSNTNHANHIVLYNQYVYFFKGRTLITMMLIPQRYRKIAERLQKQKEEQKLMTTTTI